MASTPNLLKPQLAVDYEPAKLVYPLLVSPKIDGIRGTVQNGQYTSRSLKPIPNRYIQSQCTMEMEGLDGELAVGVLTEQGLINRSTSGVMSRDGEPDYGFYVFDLINEPDMVFTDRAKLLEKRVQLLRSDPAYHFIRQLPLYHARDKEELDSVCNKFINMGFEGAMLNALDTKYKHGRATVKQRQLLKVKLFADSEAEVLAVLQGYRNDNEAFTNELGNTSRSSSKEGKVPTDMMGALHVRDIYTGVEFNIGTGFTHQQRRDILAHGVPTNHVVKYKHFPYGALHKPRIPSFIAFRHKDDL